MNFKTSLLGTACLLVLVSMAQAQTEDPDLHHVQLREGKMFTVEVHPHAKEIEIKVVGNRVAQADLEKIGLVAELKLPGRTLRLTPKGKNGSFILRNSQATSAARMSLDVHVNENHEHFDFELLKKP